MQFEQLENRYLLTDSDDSIAEALMLGALSTTARSVVAVISPDTDVNLVGFDVTAGQVVDFDIDTAANGPAGLGSYIRLFNAQGNQLASNDDGAVPGENNVGFDSYLRFSFPTSGTYYLGTSNYNNIQYSAVTGDGDNTGGFYSLGNYVLVVKALPIDLDDALSEAVAKGAVSNTPITVDSSLVTDVDVNMIRFSVVAGQVVEFDIDTQSNGPAGLGAFVRLFDTQGTQLAFNDDGVAPGENTIGFDSFLRYTFSTAGDYFLGVSNFNNVQYDPMSGNGDISGGRYSIGSYKLFMQTATVVIEDPNDSISEATTLGTVRTTPTFINASITPDTDVNMISFNVFFGQVVDFDIDTAMNGSGGLGSFLRLFDSQGTPLAFNDDGLAPGESRLGFDAYFRYTFATAGTYYLGVSNFNNFQYNAVTGQGDSAGGLNTVGSYQLIVTALPVDTDDSISESVQLGTISSLPRTVDNSLVTDVDVNMVAFTVSSGQVVDFDIDTSLNGPGGLGSYVRLFNAQGQQLAFNNDAAAPGENVIGYDAYFRYTFVSGGVYYVGVSNFNNDQYDPLSGNGDTAGGFNSIGSYQLIVQTVPEIVTDLNDTIAEAAALGAVSTTPIAVSANIALDTDVNMVGFIAIAGQVVDFDIDTVLNGTGGLGSFLRLFDVQGNPLAVNDDDVAPGESRLGFDAYLRYTFSTAGTYYLGVSNYNNVQYSPITGDSDTPGGQNTIGVYQLIIQALPVDTNDAISEALDLGTVSNIPIVVNASIATDVDVNLVAFDVASGQVVDFDIDTPLNGPGGLGSFIRLFNTQGQVLDFNNDAAAPGENFVGFDAYLRYAFPTGGTYYLGVSNLNNSLYDPLTGNGDFAGGQNTIGTYQLIVRSVNLALDVSVNPLMIPERNGSATGTVFRNDADLSQTLVVNLTSSDPRSASVPATVIFLANQSAVNFTIAAVDDQVVSGTKRITITAFANGFSPGIAQIDITDSNSSWQNPINPYDVDGDNTVSPLDVLAIVNYLNSVGSGPITSGSPPPYLDVDSDNFVSPLDALVIINFLNSQNGGKGDGEGVPRKGTAAVSSAVPLDFVDDYFSNLGKARTSVGTRRAR